MNEKRSTLSLPKDKKPRRQVTDDVFFQVVVLDVQLPARQFTIQHKVAELGQTSLTTEFLLRLLHSADGMDESDVCRFFGFSLNEMSFVVDEAESRSLVAREDGRLWLTDEGFGLFKTDEYPAIFEVVQRTEKAGFDLISIAPCEQEWLEPFEFALPELQIEDEDRAANASSFVRESFRRFYSEIIGRRERDASLAAVRRSLYSVDDVYAGDRFAALVPVIGRSSVLNPSEPEPILDAWRVGHEIDDRSGVVNAVAVFFDSMKCARQDSDDDAYRILLDVAPGYFKEYLRRDGTISWDRYVRESATRAGELRSDRPTTSILGPLYTPDNAGRVVDAMEYGRKARPAPLPSEAWWIVPSLAHWGATRALVALLRRVEGVEDLEHPAETKATLKVVGVVSGKPNRHIGKAFTDVRSQSHLTRIPSALEVLVLPNVMAAVMVHAPLGVEFGFPVPIGIVSFDPDVVDRVTRLVHGWLPQDGHAPAATT